MFVICGLGNPGRQYEATRHNMGFLTMDVLSSRLGVRIDRIKFKALTGEARIGSEKVVLVKPQTFMNLSGESLQQVVDFYKPEHDRLIVVYDDVDLAPGALRIRAGGSSGTHNGMRSVIYLLGFDDFPRIRIGIGQDRRIPLDRYVLSSWTEDERPLLAEAVENAAAACEEIVRGGSASAMQKYNRRSETQKKETDGQGT